jgi:hypothetical protein
LIYFVGFYKRILDSTLHITYLLLTYLQVHIPFIFTWNSPSGTELASPAPER